jgi:glycerol-3-phosphate dehydrogenase (NAD+)
MDLSGSTRAAVMSQGLKELYKINHLFNPSFKVETLLLSCGVADVVATSLGGRNRRCAAEFAKRRVLGQDVRLIIKVVR